VDRDIERRLSEIGRLTGDWRRNEARAAATLAIGVTTTPFDQRERLLEVLLRLAGVGDELWSRPLVAPGGDIVPAAPRDALLQLVDRERTYLSNVPIHTPLSRVCRALVRLGVLDHTKIAS
jgi:hypothetical protein